MQDDERVGRLGRKSNVKIDIPLVNETKPYAGEGGMKKLLARRRMEAEKYEQKTEVIGSDDAEEKVHVGVVENHTNDARPTLNGRSDELHTGVDPTRPSSHPPPASKDWYSNASSSSTSASVSSLRVGRTKTRAHIVRPIARPMKTKFSAAYEDDDSMDDVDVPQGESEKQMEREMLDEAAKRAPVFKIPEGFSFAKEVCVQNFLLFFSS
jgi:nucleoporin NUP1